MDKAELVVGGRTLLERALDALRDADPLVVVGPRRPVERSPSGPCRSGSPPVEWTREDPAGGGPVAGLRAGLDRVPVRTALVAVLATDHPNVTVATITRLAGVVRGDPNCAGAILTDGGGAPQWLVGVWRARPLREAVPENARGVPVRSVVGALDPVRLPSSGSESSDVDTFDDLRWVRGD